VVDVAAIFRKSRLLILPLMELSGSFLSIIFTLSFLRPKLTYELPNDSRNLSGDIDSRSRWQGFSAASTIVRHIKPMGRIEELIILLKNKLKEKHRET
jgi:TRAP-type mannitol/chloroaromatic compound transport system permease large subunit